VRCTRAALPWLRKAEWGRIVNVSAHSTKRQTPTLIGYTAAKSALTSMSKNLAKTLAKENILVNTVSPGTFLSGGVKTWLRHGEQRGSTEQPRRLNRSSPDFGSRRPRPCRAAHEIGAVIAFCVAPQQLHDGANVNVDGGSDFA
jgi:NAD(P)-dependent dehydrogenase (short-subunit alcohol dehydrogenase family)